jgi:TM2 domain-containing membrane protein YozV
MKNFFTYLFSGAIILVIATSFDYIIDSTKDTSNLAGLIGSVIIVVTLILALGFSSDRVIKQMKEF